MTLRRAGGRDRARAPRAFADAAASLAMWSMGANQSIEGVAINRALLNLCVVTGQIGSPGAGPLSLTGQPNAMGGRETGGLAHLLPGYRKVVREDHRAEVEAHWGLPAGPHLADAGAARHRPVRGARGRPGQGGLDRAARTPRCRCPTPSAPAPRCATPSS